MKDLKMKRETERFIREDRGFRQEREVTYSVPQVSVCVVNKFFQNPSPYICLEDKKLRLSSVGPLITALYLFLKVPNKLSSARIVIAYSGGKLRWYYSKKKYAILNGKPMKFERKYRKNPLSKLCRFLEKQDRQIVSAFVKSKRAILYGSTIRVQLDHIYPVDFSDGILFGSEFWDLEFEARGNGEPSSLAKAVLSAMPELPALRPITKRKMERAKLFTETSLADNTEDLEKLFRAIISNLPV